MTQPFTQNENNPNIVGFSEFITSVACYDTNGNPVPIEKISVVSPVSQAILDFNLAPTAVERITDALAVIEDAENYFKKYVADCKKDGETADVAEAFVDNIDIIKNCLQVYRDHTAEDITD